MAGGIGFRGWWARLTGGGRGEPSLDLADPGLQVVASSVDEVESCGSVLERAAAATPAWDGGAPAVSRHHLSVTEDAADQVVAIGAQTGYTRYPGGVTAVAGAGEAHVGGGNRVRVTLARVERLDALHLAQERARMAGLAQRFGGTVLGWDALQ
ncbi:hypothetical protein [Tomitella fengzijianii]|uniref:Uncharacterized protein n=1 Tax=Tomitella fengzijianii TaxID=2597660 RepID=A0A516X499_9ACTN|nr:hypothetical protein [Tomitella fengzijianii]QDQ97898.1 hypothetical protein FO059_11965 [Tomitella fengzijianii]